MPTEHAATTAEYLLYADLHGIDSHGCAMLEAYRRGIGSGAICVAPTIEVVRQDASTALLDGGGGLGFVPADAAMRLAIEACRHGGVGAVAVRNSGHFGAAGAYAALAARAGFIGLATTNTREPAVVPTGGRRSMLGTNPIAFAAPAAAERPFLLDMATSTVPLGRVALAAHRGERIPDDWAVDERGRPERSARRAVRARRLTPLGGSAVGSSHKGYGLAVAVEILSALLPGAAATEAGSRVGHFLLALDPARFRAPDEFAPDVDALLGELRASPALDPANPVRVAGDPEFAAAEERSRRGIPLARGVVEDLRAVARACGAPFLLDAAG
jgi:LDH2 family malate/lactate/ureidoglycolate dehydrogenase